MTRFRAGISEDYFATPVPEQRPIESVDRFVVLAANPMVHEGKVLRPQIDAFRRALVNVIDGYDKCAGIGIALDHQGHFDAASTLDPNSRYYDKLNRRNARSAGVRLRLNDLAPGIRSQYEREANLVGIDPGSIHVLPEGWQRRLISSQPELTANDDFVTTNWDCSISADRTYVDPDNIIACRAIAALTIANLTRYVMESPGVDNVRSVRAFWEADESDEGDGERNSATALFKSGEIALRHLLSRDIQEVRSVFVDPRQTSSSQRVQTDLAYRSSNGEVVTTRSTAKLSSPELGVAYLVY